MQAFEYKGYTIKFEYGGWGVNGSMFENKEAAKAYVDGLTESKGRLIKSIRIK